MYKLQRYAQTVAQIPSLGDVVDYLKKNQKCTIADIVEATGLSHPTVAHALRLAQEADVAVKKEIANSSGGRRAQIYALNPDFIHFALIVVREEGVVYQIRDFEGKVLSTVQKKCDKSDFIVALTRIVEGITIEDVLVETCAISLPCVVNGPMIEEWARLGLRKVNIVEQIETKTGVKVRIENDMKLFSLTGCQDEEGDIQVSLYVDKNSVGIGVSIDGKVFKGASGYAGEIKYCPNMGGVVGDKAVRAALNAIAMYNPHSMTIFAQDTAKASSYVNAISKRLPEYLLPRFVIYDDYVVAQMQGLWELVRGVL